MSASRGTPFDDVFAELTKLLGVPVVCAPDDDPSTGPRVVWTDDGFATEAIPYTLAGGRTFARQAIDYRVAVYGASKLEVYERAGELVAHIDNLIGPPQGAPPSPGFAGRDGYRVGRASAVVGGDGVSAGYATTIPITLYRPIVSDVRAAHAVTSTTFTATAAAGQGANAGSLSGAAS